MDSETAVVFIYKHTDLIREYVTRILVEDIPEDIPVSHFSAHVAATHIASIIRGWAWEAETDPLELWQRVCQDLLQEDKRPHG